MTKQTNPFTIEPEELGSWKILLQEVGKNAEDAGRMLQRRPAFTKEELRGLESALRNAARTVKIIRKTAAGEV